MSDNDRWLLPQGIEEVLPEQAARLDQLRRSLLDLFSSWGYELVMPPFIDFLESLLTGTGKDLELQTFKLTDELTGRMMGIRADMTPQVARIDAHHLEQDVPVRMCYLETVLVTRPQEFSGSRSPIQVGAELYGYAGVESDVEVLRLMLQALTVTGIKEVHVDIGHVGIFRGLARQANLNETQEATLFDALQRKAQPEIDTFLASLQVDNKLRQMLASLPDLNGDTTMLGRARSALKGSTDDVQAALDDLEKIAQALQRYIPDTPLYFDLAELRGYAYHTGIVFAAYVLGRGQAIAWGGRYDDIGQVFGRARPATGFSMDLKSLVLLSPDDNGQISGIFAPDSDDPELQQMMKLLRSKGERVICELPDQKGGAREMECDRELQKIDGKWTIVDVKN